MNKPDDVPQTQEYIQPEQEVVSGMDQMRQFQNGGRMGGPIEQQDQVQLLQNQIYDLTKFQNRLKQFDE